MRLLLADPDTSDRWDLRELLEGYGIVVAGEATAGSDAIRDARRLKPDLTLIDVSISDMPPDEAVQAIVDADRKARVVMLAHSLADSERELLDCLLAGACGYLFKDSEAAEIVAGLQVATRGPVTVSPSMATSLIERLREQRRRERDRSLPKPPRLTRREREILKLLSQGRENSAIAAELFISPATVKTHVAHLLDKLDLDNRVQAAVFAVRHGIV